MRKDISERINQIKEWISERRSKNWMCKQLRCKPSTLDSYLKKNNIEYSGNMGNKGYGIPPNRRNSIVYLGTNLHITSYKLKNKLFEDGIKDERCEICGNKEWMGEKIPLDLHHKDGNRFNNNLENLQILCKNCHGLTPSHSRKK